MAPGQKYYYRGWSWKLLATKPCQYSLSTIAGATCLSTVVHKKTVVGAEPKFYLLSFEYSFEDHISNMKFQAQISSINFSLIRRVKPRPQNCD